MSRQSLSRKASLSRKLSNDKRDQKTKDQKQTKGEDTREDFVARGIFGDVPLTDTERRFLTAAETGNLEQVQLCIRENGSLNLNCRDYLGRTGLQLAVLGEHYEAIQFLLDRCSLDVVEEGLLHAIKTENVKVCDMFLAHPIYSDKRARMELEFQHGFYDQEESSSSFAPDITPIVLAAQCNNFDIVHMLIQKGFTIQTPHHYFCLCTECTNHKTFDRFVHSRSRLNAYTGLGSSAYLSLSSDDPIGTAFELSRALQILAETEKEYKNEYKALSEQCKRYAVELLDLCRSNEEVMAALHGGSNVRDLSRIKTAIKYEQKKFIAHASSQEHLMSMWYTGVPWFQHQPVMMKLFLAPLGIMFIPVTAIVYVFLPYSKIGEVLRSPFMKFMNYICSYTAFLVLLFVATTLGSSNHADLFEGTKGTVNSLIMFYVLGMFWAECKQLWEEGVREYFSQIWNYMDIMMLALYTASYAVEGVIYTKTKDIHTTGLISSEDDSIPNPQILSKVLFSVANVLSFARIAYILPASETFGQLQISYGRMLQDVGKFIFIYFTVMIAFICGLTSLYSLSQNEHFSNLMQTSGTLFWAAFGMGNSEAPKISEGGSHKVVEMVGFILYGVYILGAVVVLINMLIAMMSNTFEEIQIDEDMEWKFARAKLWISFIEEGTTLPIPFNIIPTPKSILKLILFFKTCSRRKTPFDSDDTENDDDGFEFDYKAIMHKVVLRYVHKMKFDKKGETLKDDITEAKDEVLNQLNSFYSKISTKIDALEKNIQEVKHSVEIKETEAPSTYQPQQTNSASSHSINNTRADSIHKHGTARADIKPHGPNIIRQSPQLARPGSRPRETHVVVQKKASPYESENGDGHSRGRPEHRSHSVKQNNHPRGRESMSRRTPSLEKMPENKRNSVIRRTPSLERRPQDQIQYQAIQQRTPSLMRTTTSRRGDPRSPSEEMPLIDRRLNQQNPYDNWQHVQTYELRTVRGPQGSYACRESSLDRHMRTQSLSRPRRSTSPNDRMGIKEV
ncbi:short transient receptor potential channel 7-like [Haliotis rufescens]|uniref:short transient receptor potential channel 7-like n=1 Tax=Haliotis rufescens TaxID=6454 RepID=UPI00201F3FDA|nr:short transient receptor potential channel 7-like [Haliotis rufescens]